MLEQQTVAAISRANQYIGACLYATNFSGPIVNLHAELLFEVTGKDHSIMLSLYKPITHQTGDFSPAQASQE